MQPTTLRVITILTWILTTAGATNPGIVIRFNNKGLEYVDSVGIPILIQKLKTTTISDFSGDAHTPVGGIHYDLTNVHNTGVSIASSSFKTIPGVGLSLQASGISVAFTGDWSYREDHWPHIKDSGSFDVSASGVSFSLTAKIREEKGHPTISTASCSDNVNDVNFKFHGGTSWLYNLFRGKIADSLKNKLKDLICTEATKAINEQAEQELETFPVRKKIDKYAIINYAFIQSPLFTDGYLNVSLKGEFMSAIHPIESTLEPHEIPGDQPCSKMICVYLTDYVGNTAGEVYYKEGFFNATIKASEVPKSSKYQLNTTILKLIGLSKIYDMYPNRPLQLVLYCTKAPVINTQSTGINLVIDGNVEVYVVLKDNSTKFLFTLAANITASAKVNVNETILQTSIEKFGVLFSVARSAVGDIKPNVGLLNLFLHFLAQNTIIKELNERGKKGLPLPVLDNIQLLDAQIVFGKHFVSFDTDLKYTAKSRDKKTIPILP